MRLSVVTLLLVPAALGAQVPADSAREIALDEAIRLAQRNAPAAVQARGQLRTASAARTASYAAFIPNVTVSMGAAYNPDAGTRVIGDRLVGGTKYTGSEGLSLNLNLFDGGRRFYDVRAARANADLAAANELGQRYQVALDVQQTFFNALAARESESAARAQLEQAEQQMRASTSRVAAGAATRSDSLRSAILVGNAQLALLTAQNDLRTANASLTRLVATPFTVTAASADTLPVITQLPDSSELIRLAERGPAVEVAEASRTAARAAYRAARTPYLPSIDVSFGRTATGAATSLSSSFRDSLDYQSSLRFSLSYPLFNQFNREEARIRADVAAANADAALRDARLAAKQQLTQYLGALTTAAQRVRIQSTSVAAAEEDLRVQQQRYAVGASTLLDVLTSQTQLNQAQAALIAARYDYRVAKAQLEALVGRQL
ncbi:MAG: TolC family protein [Gemmatimonadaceae bacterium]